MRFGLVIFDCDGVLVDDHAVEDQVTAAMLAELGLVLPPTELKRRHRGAVDEEFWSRLAIDYRLALPEDIVRVHRSRRLEKLTTSATAVAGALELLEWLRQAGQPFCIASNGEPEKMAVTLPACGIDQFVEPAHVFSRWQVARGKPAPDIFLYAAKSLDFEPARCCVIEDSVAGVTGAVAAGMTVFAYCPSGDPEGLAALGAQVVRSLAELHPLLVR